jgi:hypothetical protein
MAESKTVTVVEINKDYKEQLERDSHMLECLDACGVVDWEGYTFATEMYEEESGNA